VRVIIAGGGTGGLATALALRKVGIDPLVLERAPAFSAIGAGLGLQVNAMKALTYIGGDAHWRQTCARIDVAEQRGLADDQLISASTYDAQVRKYGEHYYCGHRADLLASLLGPLPAECVRTGSRVVGLEETPLDVRVQLDTGEEFSGDLLVGADGLRSQVRTLLFGEQEARFTGVVVWRGLNAACQSARAVLREDHHLARPATSRAAVPAAAPGASGQRVQPECFRAGRRGAPRILDCLG